MKEGINKSSSGTTGISVLGVLMMLVLTVLLLLSFAVHEHVVQNEPPKAASSLQLDKMMVKNADGNRVSLAKLILDDYIQEDTITEEQMKNVLREGNFRYLLGDKVNVYNAWLASGGSGAFPEVTEEECIAALKGNFALIFRETGFQLRAEDEARFRENLKEPLADLNADISRTLEKGLLASVLRGMAAGWFWMIPGVLMLAVLIWQIAGHVRRGSSAGKAIRICSVTVLIPCLLLMLWGLLCASLLKDGAYPDAVKQLRGTWLTCGGIGTLGSAVLLVIGLIWKLSEKKKPAPVRTEPELAYDRTDAASIRETIPEEPPVQTIQEDAPEEEKVIRHYCRFCGQPLVNNDAKFCYKCGKPQEKHE